MSLGVQVIIGAHPHVLQPHCRHDNKLVAYSLGNFLFYPKQPPRGSSLVMCSHLARDIFICIHELKTQLVNGMCRFEEFILH